MERRLPCPICLDEIEPCDAAVLRCARDGCAGQFHHRCASLAASSSPFCPLCRRPAVVEWAVDVLRDQISQLRDLADSERRARESAVHAVETQRVLLRNEAEELLLRQQECLTGLVLQERKAALDLVSVAMSEREALALRARQEQAALRIELLDARRELNARSGDRSRTPRRATRA